MLLWNNEEIILKDVIVELWRYII